MSRFKVFLTGGDTHGWALDEDRRLMGEAARDLADLTDLDGCDLVQSMWWRKLRALPAESLRGKRVLAAITEDVAQFLAAPDGLPVRRVVTTWIARSARAVGWLDDAGLRAHYVPYLVDPTTFRELPPTESSLADLRVSLGVPSGAYLVGSFQRDTLGGALRTPKPEKGPDVFAEIVGGLRRRRYPVHVVLAGPRRHWLRGRLDELGVPWSFLGHLTSDDDMEINTLPRETINRLYNLVDLCLVASRSEGGPHAILEAAAARCKVVSTPVGIAAGVLDTGCLYHSVAEAVEMVAADIEQGALAASVERHHARALAQHVPAAVEPAVRKLYEEAMAMPPVAATSAPAVRSPRPPSHVRRLLRRLGWATSDWRPAVSLWNAFHQPPWGGGNQFMIALGKALQDCGVVVRQNDLDADVHVLNAIWFDLARSRAIRRRPAARIIHRVDGPISLIRGFDREKDELVFQLNREMASATVLQSEWSLRRLLELGFEPVSPVIIPNAVDQDIFNRQGRRPFARDRKIRLIATAWSDSPRKGGPIYRWIEEHLDWSRFEFTFVGRCSEPLTRARHIPAVGSEELARILRAHDVYVTASEKDPCSNALIEALACGLPALYRNDGGHPELVGYGGLPFEDPEEIPTRLDAIVEAYETFQDLIVVPSLPDIAQRYLEVAREVGA